MRCLRRNKQPYWHARYVSGETAYDAYGNETGGRNITYSAPEKAYANISSARNVDVVTVFGTDVNYDKVLVADKVPFDENALLWIDTPPELKSDGSTDTPPDYVVKRIAGSLNSVMLAVSKVDTRYA